MTGKAYYVTTLADWQRHAPRFANSHFILLDSPERASDNGNSAKAKPMSSAGALDFLALSEGEGSPAKIAGAERPSIAQPYPQQVVEPPVHCPEPLADRQRILVLIEADEGVHLSLEGDSAFEPLPHSLSQKPISPKAQAALAPHGVAPGATTFDASESLARIHPLLKHRVF